MPNRFVSLALLLITIPAFAQDWSSPRRGAWVREGDQRLNDLVLVSADRPCQIVIGAAEAPAVRQAGTVLAGDIQRITGRPVEIVALPDPKLPQIHLLTLGVSIVPDPVTTDDLKGKWEAYRIQTHSNAVYLVGSNFRGTAFAAYCLSERLGVDPLYHWTGYTPAHHMPLILKQTDYFKNEPTVRYRGMFHDDEDILPRPFEDNGRPSHV